MSVDVVPLERPRSSALPTGAGFLALAIAALLVAGVASALLHDNGTAVPTTPLAMVRASATTTADAGTARVTATVKSASGPLAKGITSDGGFDFTNRRGRLQIDMSKFGLSGLGAIDSVADYSSGIVMYVKFPPELSDRLGGKPWVKLDLGALMKQAGLDVDLGSLAQGQSNDPTSGLRLLRGADSVTTVGTEQVRGTNTTHYRLQVSLDKAIAEAPPDQKDALTKLASLYTVRTFPLDVWLDSDGRVRRYVQTIDPATIRLPAALAARGNPFAGPLTLTYEMYDFGAPVDVKIPPADQVTDLNGLIHQRR